MNKYIIKNCPAIYGIDDGFLCSYKEDDESEKYCYDCSDCKIKQIVELCNNIKKDHYWGMREIRFSKEILDLLDIQEIE